MSEDAAPEIAAKPANPTVILVAFVLAGLLAFGLLVWVQGIRTASARRDAFARGIDGLAAALSVSVIETGSQRFENRAERLQKLIERVQRSGGYSLIVVTDPQGTVLATTDTSLQAQSVKEMANLKKSAVKDIDGSVEAVSVISYDGNTPLGAVKVRAKL